MYNIKQELKVYLCKKNEQNTENEEAHCIWKADHNIHTGHINSFVYLCKGQYITVACFGHNISPSSGSTCYTKVTYT